MPKYAAKTTVPVGKSKEEIERILVRYGARQFLYGWEASGALIGFVLDGRQIRFVLPLPDRWASEFVEYKRGYSMYDRDEAAAEKLWEQACRQKWRALALVIKAKLEAVDSGISTFEAEFLSWTLLPSGETVGEWIGPQLEAAYDPEKGVMPSKLRLALPEKAGT